MSNEGAPDGPPIWSTSWSRCGYVCSIWQADDGGWYWEMRDGHSFSVLGYAVDRLDATRQANREAVRYARSGGR